MKTPLQELKEQLDRVGINLNNELFKKYLEKERHQLIKSYKEGAVSLLNDNTAEKYYNETFKNEKM